MEPIEYKLIRSRRRTLAIEITRDAELLVRAPMHVSTKRIEEFLFQKQDWINQHLARRQERLVQHPEPDAEKWEQLKKKAIEYVPDRLFYYAKRMGVQPTALHFSKAKTRWGSCSAKNSITFSLRLMDYPDEAIDAVIVHELAHIRYKNHGKEFYAFVLSVLPDYWERDRLLKG
jgi:predicted metal-dependent hydrolase